jgi:hypothetical protein
MAQEPNGSRGAAQRETRRGDSPDGLATSAQGSDGHRSRQAGTNNQDTFHVRLLPPIVKDRADPNVKCDDAAGFSL